MTRAHPTFSVVINTLNRADSLAATLESLPQLRYPGSFEVIVVNGPSSDHTADVLKRYEGRIRTASCAVPNLSMSRNVGIDASSGEIVAFIDDDAVPEPEWLTQLSEAYDAPDVGAVGGAVFDQTGYSMQYVYSTANRLGTADWKAARPVPEYCFPRSYEFPYLQGTNTSFRRTALEEIGGFDEEIEFYLDETEVCCRLVDAGFLIRQLPNAYVHHNFAPSHIRDTDRIIRHRFPVLKNKLYFALKHARGFVPIAEILEDHHRFVAQHRADVQFHIDGGRIPATELDAFADQSERAWTRGLEQGMRTEWPVTPRTTRDPARFAPLATRTVDGARTIVLVTKDYVPGHAGGIARFNHDLARALAADGHIVHVITQSSDIDRVDLDEGVWVHRLLVHPERIGPPPVDLVVPEQIWRWSATARREVDRIALRRPIDVVEAPLWDCEAVAFLSDRRWPVVVSLQTSLHAWIENHPELSVDANWMRAFGEPMLDLERRMMTGADRLRAISRAIAVDLGIAYGIPLVEKSDVLPLGLIDRTAPDTGSAPDARDLRVLFVGRLEKRKGLDALLPAIATVCEMRSDVRFTLIGDDSLTSERGRTYKDEFRAQHDDAPWLDRVEFLGKVDDATLEQAYRDADLFVAPSRYESFGLIFLEAMRAGKPCIGCNVGGIPEVVADGETGLLVAPDSPAELAAAITSLLDDPERRARWGRNARDAFVERFTSARMAKDSMVLYAAAIANRKQSAAGA